MKVLFNPQLNRSSKLEYTFSGNVVTAYLDGQLDTFDFTGLADGQAAEIKSTLPINPVISASMTSGVLTVELLYFHDVRASQEELFPVLTDASQLAFGVKGA